MNICVIGGGNIGTTLAADLANLHPDFSIRLLTSKPGLFQNPILVNDIERNTTFYGKLDRISSDPEETVYGADVIFITHPSFLIDDTLSQIKAYVKKGAYVGIIPGFGGCEFYWAKYFDESVTFFGYQRVPYIARMKKYGGVSDLTSRKSQLIIGAIPSAKVQNVCELVREITLVPCVSVPNYLAVTLTPSNPLLHTARIYDLFGNTKYPNLIHRNPKFYAEWTKNASDVLLEMDREHQRLCKSINGLDLTSVISLKTHYESKNTDELTNKMRGIESLKNIGSPMLQIEGGFVPDIHSRYFVEDFPYGLCIIKGFCEIYGLETPAIDKVLQWYEKFVGVEYFVNGVYNGKDLANTAIPQNFGLRSPSDVVSYYSGINSYAPPHILRRNNNEIIHLPIISFGVMVSA